MIGDHKIFPIFSMTKQHDKNLPHKTNKFELVHNKKNTID